MTNHDQLKAALSNIRYPTGIVACPGEYCAITGQSFFLGGKGHIGNDLPVGGIMYLGHNFDKVSGFEDSVRRGIEENLTWRKIREGVLPILAEERIWFTNYFMGLQSGSSNVGALARTDGFDQYESDCWDMFRLQVMLQKPSQVAVLGGHVVKVLGAASRLNIPTWVTKTSQPLGRLRLIKYRKSVELDGSRHSFYVSAIYHPAYGRSEKQLAGILADSVFLSKQTGTIDKLN